MTTFLPLEMIVNILVVFLSLLYWGVVFITLYHLNRFGIGVQPKRLSLIFLFGSVILFSATIILYTQVDLVEILKSLQT